MGVLWVLLAAQATTASRPIDILIPLGWLTLAAAAIIVMAMLLRRVFRDDSAPGATTFTLSDLRRLKAEGQISDAEFERTKAALIAHSRAAMENDQTVSNDSDNQNNQPDGPPQ